MDNVGVYFFNCALDFGNAGGNKVSVLSNREVAKLPCMSSKLHMVGRTGVYSFEVCACSWECCAKVGVGSFKLCACF